MLTRLHDPLAIVIRGPPCSGKTTVCRTLARKFEGISAVVNLDDEWWYGDRRHAGTYRYVDLQTSAPVLIIELGLGEPPDWRSPGATLNPEEWVTMIEADRRRVSFFHLTAPTHVLLERARKRGGDWSRMIHARSDDYAHGDLCSPAAFFGRLRARYDEELIDTERLSPEAVAERIASGFDPS